MAVWIYEFAGLRLINYVPFYRYISHNLYAKRVNDKHPLREGVFIVYSPIDKHHPKERVWFTRLLIKKNYCITCEMCYT